MGFVAGREPSNIVHLSDRRERQDNGVRPAFLEDASIGREVTDLRGELRMPSLRPLADLACPTDEPVYIVARELHDARANLAAAMKEAGRDDDLRDVHRRLAAILLYVGALQSDLADRGDAA